MSIQFFTEDPLEYLHPNQNSSLKWLLAVAEKEGADIEELNYIFCTDDYLLEINKTHLEHDYYTDVITFDNRMLSTDPIAGDIFISYDRVRENAEDFEASIDQELARVMVHGLLHLIGYGDKTSEQASTMREKENYYLSLR